MRWSRDLGLDPAIFTLQPTVRVGEDSSEVKTLFPSPTEGEANLFTLAGIP